MYIYINKYMCVCIYKCIYMRVSVQGSGSPQDEPVESFRSDGLCQHALNPLPRETP